MIGAFFNSLEDCEACATLLITAKGACLRSSEFRAALALFQLRVALDEFRILPSKSRRTSGWTGLTRWPSQPASLDLRR